MAADSIIPLFTVLHFKTGGITSAVANIQTELPKLNGQEHPSATLLLWMPTGFVPALAGAALKIF
jgi:hypothetical protein